MLPDDALNYTVRLIVSIKAHKSFDFFMFSILASLLKLVLFVRLFMDRAQSSEVRGVGFCGSSGTPLLFGHGVNPSIRLFDFDVSTY